MFSPCGGSCVAFLASFDPSLTRLPWGEVGMASVEQEWQVQPKVFLPLREGAACRGCERPRPPGRGPAPQQHCLPGAGKSAGFWLSEHEGTAVQRPQLHPLSCHSCEQRCCYGLIGFLSPLSGTWVGKKAVIYGAHKDPKRRRL